jgi:hypothetical protein
MDIDIDEGYPERISGNCHELQEKTWKTIEAF